MNPSLTRATELALVQHLFAAALTALVLDGGVLFRLALFVIASHWILIALVLTRRRCAPTRLDLRVIALGFVPVGIFAIVVAGLLGRTPS